VPESAEDKFVWQAYRIFERDFYINMARDARCLIGQLSRMFHVFGDMT
jgi:hypothetical protein